MMAVSTGNLRCKKQERQEQRNDMENHSVANSDLSEVLRSVTTRRGRQSDHIRNAYLSKSAGKFLLFNFHAGESMNS